MTSGADNAWVEHRAEDGTSVLYLSGAWRLANLAAIARSLEALRLRGLRHCVLDGSALQALDTSAGFILFRHLAGLGCTEATVSARGFDPRHRRLLALVHERMRSPPAERGPAQRGLLRHIGAATVRVGRLLASQNVFLGAA